MTGLSCLSITASHAPLDVLERLSYSREERAGRLTFLRSGSRARAVAVLSTCQRTEAYATWLAGRSAAAALHRMRSGAEDIAREELARVAGDVPAEVRSAMERVLLKTVHRLVHKPTLELRAAVEADDSDLVSVLAGLFDAAPCPAGGTAGDAGLLAGDPDTTAGARRPALDVQR